MINQVYRLISPRRITAAHDEIEFNDNLVKVRPKYLSICAADQRYFQGTREAKVLKKKLPMALIHEGVGEVLYDPTNTFDIGDYVLMVPNHPTEVDDVIEENYLRSSSFRASGFDGFLQDLLVMDSSRLVKLPPNINLQAASFSELITVSYHAIRRFMNKSHSRKNVIGVWGDGNLGYITTLLLKHLLPESKVYVFGLSEEKLNYFTFADEVYNVDLAPTDLAIDHAFECVGGIGSQFAINQIIDHINPEGFISILGVSEANVEINTRMVLEKGLTLLGSSRSPRSDFEAVAKLYEEHPEILNYLENLIGNVHVIKSINDLTNAFDDDIKTKWGKTILDWRK